MVVLGTGKGACGSIKTRASYGTINRKDIMSSEDWKDICLAVVIGVIWAVLAIIGLAGG
jgi:hypothetical protein